MLSDGWIQALLVDETQEGCRDWPYKSLTRGYPVVKVGGRKGQIVRVSHIVLERSGRPQPPGTEVLHSCDRPICCAPWHLRWGTRRENVDDAVARGRVARGMRLPHSKLSADDVRAIRRDPRTQAEIAVAYGVTQSVVSRVKSRQSHRYIV